jgi:F0F1-type ATP synthase membrane subunit c/vacuolar-type H+-ATPase subunit K
MADDSSSEELGTGLETEDNGTGLGLAVALAALAAIGAGLAIQQIIRRRLSKPEMNRLKFYRYLRERGHLES